MKRCIRIFSTGLVAGVALTGIVVWKAMPGMMLDVHESSLGFDETVAAIEQSVQEHGWKSPKVYDIQGALRNAGHEDMTRVKIISLCQPHHAYEILKEDANKKVTAVMPCRMGVYEDSEGRVYISEMNIGLMSKMFGGTIAQVMGQAAREEQAILAGIIAR